MELVVRGLRRLVRNEDRGVRSESLDPRHSLLNHTSYAADNRRFDGWKQAGATWGSGVVCGR